jgi:hypothetical protein
VNLNPIFSLTTKLAILNPQRDTYPLDMWPAECKICTLLMKKTK